MLSLALLVWLGWWAEAERLSGNSILLARSVAAREHPLTRTNFTALLLPEDRVISTTVHQHNVTTFYYLLHREVKHLTFVLAACRSPINWTLSFREQTGRLNLEERGWGGEVKFSGGGWGRQGETVREAWPGLYLVTVSSRGPASASLQVYVTASTRGLLITQAPAKVHLLPAPPGHVVLVWPPSRVDRDSVRYSVVLSEGEHAGWLCSIEPGQTVHDAGRSTKLEVALAPGPALAVDVFATHLRTNLTILAARGEVPPRRKPRPTSLRDRRPATVDLSLLRGRANFRYKVRRSGDRLEWYIEACGGGVVHAEVRLRKRLQAGPIKVSGLSKLVLPGPPQPGARYVLRLTAIDQEHLAHVSSIEVMGSMSGLPVVSMPADTEVREYRGMRRCRSVVLGWRPAHYSQPVLYCMRAALIAPDPCAKVFPPQNFASLQCRQINSSSNLTVITQELRGLIPDTTYYVQVTAEANKTKTSTYNIIKIHTKPSCV